LKITARTYFEKIRAVIIVSALIRVADKPG
jgi:hypothetical protein